ncbi:MAG: CGNR zinc finger domain-containing protein [Gemmatimonadales bacterium]|nr:CGNR zinc finger domain-containing protein [Gemmatimonadales bacterium]MDQ3427273.1 CGNR zinc finger domain-containing protein [Gemmatimonadota bacterium]
MTHSELILLGDAVWLDFVNSARGRTLSPPDLLPDAQAYARWSRALQLDAGGSADFPLALSFRHQLSALAEALHAGLQPPAASITAINAQLAHAPGTHQLTRVSGTWRLRFAPLRPAGTLEAVARSAAATLADPQTFVRQCAAETCSLFFSDDSPNQSRRWCTPALCGQNGRVERRRGQLH